MCTILYVSAFDKKNGQILLTTKDLFLQGLAGADVVMFGGKTVG